MAYRFPHRAGGGLCRWPEPPAEVRQGQRGRKVGVLGRCGNSAIRKRLMKGYGFHPIRDRQKIRRFLPKLYVATCRRSGWPRAYTWLGGYVGVMLVTERGAPPGFSPVDTQEVWHQVLSSTSLHPN